MKPAIVAADTNLLRHPTPRRYLTVIEALRDRSVMVLPTVNGELHRHLPIQAGEYIDVMARRKGLDEHAALRSAKAAAGAAAIEWWRRERERNDSAYTHAPDLGPEHYAGVAAALPSKAFADDNKNDQWIYAQAMVHDIDVLASRNRNTMLIEVLKEHFVASGYPDAPVTVRSLWEHTTALADAEHRPIAEVALETVLCAVMPNAWTGSPEEMVAVKWSMERFVRNLRTRDGSGETPDPEREKLAHLLHHTVKESSLATLLDRCNDAYAILPENARETEMRYHTATRAAVRTTGVNLWER
jgi:hypothetical protein